MCHALHMSIIMIIHMIHKKMFHSREVLLKCRNHMDMFAFQVWIKMKIDS